jgi:hypothetical protein
MAKLAASCTYPAEEGLRVRTGSARVIRARKMILELLLASCPQSRIIQDLPQPTEFGNSVSGRNTKLHPVRIVRPDVRGTDDGAGHRFPGAGNDTTCGHAV